MRSIAVFSIFCCKLLPILIIGGQRQTMMRQFSKKMGKNNTWDPNDDMEVNEEDRKRERALVKLEKAKKLATDVDQISFKHVTSKNKKRSLMTPDTLPGQHSLQQYGMYAIKSL